MAGPMILSDPSVLNLFKKKYLKYQENVQNGSNVTMAKVKRLQDFVGDELQKAVDFGWIGGAGASIIPTANRGIYQKYLLTSQNLYVTAEVDRKTMKQSKDPGAFVEAQKHMVQKVTEKFAWLRSLALFGDGSGKLGRINAVTDNGGGNYTLTILTTGTTPNYHRSRFCVRDIVNIESGNTDRFEIISHTPASATIVVQRLSGGGGQVPAGNDYIYLQNAENAMPYGLRYALDATAGSTIYGVTVGDGNIAVQNAAAGATIDPDRMNQVMLSVHEQCGKSPDLIVTSYEQMRKLLAQIEDLKRYFTSGEKVKSRYGDFSFNGVQFMSIDGPVPIVVDRFCDSDRMYFLNTDYIEIHDAPDTPGWVDDDTGSIWLRKQTDQFESRYACYTNTLILPWFHGVITGAATT